MQHITTLVPVLFLSSVFAFACSKGQTGDAGLGVESGNDRDAGDAQQAEPSGTADDDVSEPTGCDPYACDCGVGQTASGGPGTPPSCVGTPLCNEDAECPATRGGEIEPLCMSNGDVVLNGYTGRCALPCTADSICPEGMQCISSVCQFATGPVPNPGEPGGGMVAATATPVATMPVTPTPDGVQDAGASDGRVLPDDRCTSDSDCTAESSCMPYQEEPTLEPLVGCDAIRLPSCVIENPTCPDETPICNVDEGCTTRGVCTLRCDEGYLCQAPFECGGETTGGRCVRPSCDETHACGPGFECEPGTFASEEVLPVGATYFGCAPITCDRAEGTPCDGGFVCEPENELADAWGCRASRCEDEAFECVGLYACEPSHEQANDHGCRPLSCELSEVDCAPNACRPDGPVSTPNGCSFELACQNDAECGTSEFCADGLCEPLGVCSGVTPAPAF